MEEQIYISEESTRKLNEKSIYILDILCNKLRLPHQEYSEDDFNVDLVIKIKVPKEFEEMYIPRSQQVQLNQLLISPSKEMQDAYRTAEAMIIKDMGSNSNQQTLFSEFKIRNYDQCKEASGNKLSKKSRMVNIEEDQPSQIQINYVGKMSNKISLFMLQYNTIMYQLQGTCGFHAKSYMMHNEDSERSEIYILLSHSIEKLYKLADEFLIKKEIDYKQIDFYYNDPVDSCKRPLRYHHIIKDNLDFVKVENKINRKFKLNSLKWNQFIINQVQLEMEDQEKFQQLTYKVNTKFQQIIKQKMELQFSEKKFLFDCNRRIIHEGVREQFKRIKRLRLFHEQLRNICSEFKYPVHRQEKTYHDFTLPAKRLNFFEKLRVMLRYKELVVGPQGQISHFLKMERIKLAYLSLKKVFKIQHLHRLGCELFALNDNFQRYGKNQNEEVKKGIKGGLDNKNLNSEWATFLPWRSNIETIRNYYGTHLANEIMVKNQIITFFLFVGPLNFIGQIVNQILFTQYSSVYHIISFSINLLAFNIFLSFWGEKQSNFADNFTSRASMPTFLQSYKGPFIRNIITDQINQFSREETVQSRLKSFLVLLLMLFLLAAEGGFFYGIRLVIININILFPVQDVLRLSSAHVLMYCVYYWVNYVLLHFFKKLFKLVTKFQNYSSEEDYVSSLKNKIFLFQLSLEIIPIFFFIILEPFQKVSCYAVQCSSQLNSYIQSRYAAYLSLLLWKLIKMIAYLFARKVQTQHQVIRELKRQKNETYQAKLNKLLFFILKESRQKQIKLELNEEIIAVMHFLVFTPFFAISPLIALGGMLVDNFMQKIDMLAVGRRPIPKVRPLQLYSDRFKTILSVSIIVSCWCIFYTGQIVQYEMKDIMLIFFSRETVKEENIFTLIVVVTFIFVIIYHTFSTIVRQFSESIVTSKFKNRKKLKTIEYFYLKSVRVGLGDNNKNMNQTVVPIKTMFRTFNLAKSSNGFREKPNLNETRKTSMDDLFESRFQSGQKTKRN